MTKLKERMDAFSDAVIAIIITIMVLELPLPEHDSFAEYLQFGKGIGIFFISFCFVANIWYQHSMLFSSTEKANDRIFIREFVFLGFLSLTPVFTKVIIYDTNRTTVMAYGALTTIVSALFMWLTFSIVTQEYPKHHDIKQIFYKIFGNHNNFLGSANLIILVLAYFYPQWALVIYLAVPVITFFTTRHDFTDLKDVTQLSEGEQQQFLNADNGSLGELRKKQRQIMQKYRGNWRNNPQMQAEISQLFEGHPEYFKRFEKHRHKHNDSNQHHA